MRTTVACALVAAVAAQAGPTIFLNACSPSASRFQKWTLSPNGTKIWLTATSGNNPPMCLDIEGFDTKPGATVYTWPCGADGAGVNENWAVSASSIASGQTPPTCLAVAAASPGDITNGTTVTTATCSGADPMQTLVYSAATGLIVHSPSGLCVDGGSHLAPFDFCTVAGHASWTLCNPTASLDDRAADAVSRMSIGDKIQALNTAQPFLSSLGMPAYQWWSEATHGISGPGVSHDAAYPGGVNTALPITTSCSFNRTLWHETGNAIAREGRAYYNVGLAGSTFWTPVRLSAGVVSFLLLRWLCERVLPTFLHPPPSSPLF